MLFSILLNVDQVSRYDPNLTNFQHFVGDANFDQFNTLDYGKGYVIYVNNPQGATVTINGTAPATQGISLSQGWNLIPYPYLSQNAVQQGLGNLQFNVDYDLVSSYNSATGQFEQYPGSLQNLDPKKSYYLHCLQPATWNIQPLSRKTDFSYDGDGGRVTRVSEIDKANTTTYIGSLFENTDYADGSPTTRKKHIYAGANRVCVVDNGSPQFFHGDHLGSSNIITDATGAQVSLYEYSPFGEVSHQSGTYTTDIKYTGKIQDDTGLYYYGARYYDPVLGRFITPDSIIQAPQDPQSLNRYAYCRNNPIKYVDPSGNWFWMAIVAIAKAVAAYAAAHPIIFGAAMGGFLGGVNAAISGTNIWQGIGIGILGGAIGGAVGMGVGDFLSGGLGEFWSGMAGAGLGGATAGAATSAALGGDVGLGALAGLAGGVAGFMGSYKMASAFGYVSGNVASAAVAGQDLGEAALGGFIDASLVTTVGLMLPMPTVGEQGAEGGDLIFYKAGGVTDPVGLFLSYLQGSPISHNAIAVSATEQVDSHVKGGGVRKRDIRSNRQGRVVKWAGSGNQKFVALAVQYGKDNAFKYWLGPGREICSTFISRTAKETGLSAPGFSPASQYYNIEGIPYHNFYKPKEQ